MIQVCMIIKNGADTILETLNSYKNYVSRFVILDTGSTDKTLNLLQRFDGNLTVFERPFKGFSESRNECLDLAYDDRYEWTIMIDDSYKLLTNLNDLKQVPNVFSCVSLVVSKIDGMQYRSNRILRTTSRIRYLGDIHEYLNCDKVFHLESIKLLDVVTEKQLLRTYDRNKQDLLILSKKSDSRSMYYKACTLNNLFITGKCSAHRVIEAYKTCLSMEGHPEERFTCCIMIGNLMYSNNFEIKKCIPYYIQSALIFPTRSCESYLYLYLMTGVHLWLERAYKNCLTVPNCSMAYDRNVYGPGGIIDKLYTDSRAK